MRKSGLIVALGAMAVGCGGPKRSGASGGSLGSFSATLTATDSAGSLTASISGGTAGSGGGTGAKFDVGSGATDSAGEGGNPAPTCKVVDDMDAVGQCGDKAPPDSFTPDVQWSWAGQAPYVQSIVIGLVANLTDDNGDGAIDLCDVPEVIVNAFAGYGTWDGYLFALDGETGTVQWQSPVQVDGTVTPALGDIDADGLPEIVAVSFGSHELVAFEHDGTLKWQGSVWGDTFGAIALADLDGDGHVEIIAGNIIASDVGITKVTLNGQSGSPGFGNATTAADLDGDGNLEVILGPTAFHDDGTPYYTAGIDPGFPQVANLDSDPDPEILVVNQNGISLLDPDGTILYQDQRPTGDAPSLNSWHRPATVHDFDGDGVSEFAVSSSSNYAVYENTPSIVWTAPVSDTSGVAAGTAFDFLGAGVAEAMYADENNLYVYDGMGSALLTVPRSSGTLIEYPVVADVDNDGSAEIVVVSNEGWMGNQTAPLVQVIRDQQDRWIQARRIWNEHVYHVTNVREDSTIPKVEPRSWELLNTYRTNAQIENGGLCVPPPPG